MPRGIRLLLQERTKLMKTALFDVATIAGPSGKVIDNWPCIAYRVQVTLRSTGKPMIETDYHLGVGHVKWNCKTNYYHLTKDQQHIWGACQNPRCSRNFTDKHLYAETAAALAKMQKVKPDPDNVIHSLLMDGSPCLHDQSFSDWAADLGYSDDSIKAKETYEACMNIGRAIIQAVGRDGYEALLEAYAEY